MASRVEESRIRSVYGWQGRREEKEGKKLEV